MANVCSSELTLVYRGQQLGKRRDARVRNVSVVGQRVEARTRPALVAGVKVGRGKGVGAEYVDGLGQVALLDEEGAVAGLRLDLHDGLVQAEKGFVIFAGCAPWNAV